MEAKAKAQSCKAREAAQGKVGTRGANRRTTEQLLCPLPQRHGPNPTQGHPATPHAQMGSSI